MKRALEVNDVIPPGQSYSVLDLLKLFFGILNLFSF
jgi:hypothetical protein